MSRFSASPEKLEDPAILGPYFQHDSLFGWGLCSQVGHRAQNLPPPVHITHLAHGALEFMTQRPVGSRRVWPFQSLSTLEGQPLLTCQIRACESAFPTNALLISQL